MSDSDDDSLRSKVSSIFQKDNNMTMIARGPKGNSVNVTGFSFRNGLAANMDMPVNFERDRYGDSLSLRSAPIHRPLSYNHSSYQYGLGSQRSTYNGRDESSTSLHSADTAASVISAANIVFAFNNGKLNKYDLRSIKDACNKLMKTQRRKRIEKRRKLKLFFKGMRRKSGDDSGEQGSDSSISDDCRSVRTTICKENIPAARHTRNLSNFSTNMQISRNRMIDMSHYTMNMRDNSVFTDCTESIKQNTVRNMISINRSNARFGERDKFNTVKSHGPNPTKVTNRSLMIQSEPFNNEFLKQSRNVSKVLTDQKHHNNNDYNGRKNKIDTTNQERLESDSDPDQNILTLDIQNVSQMNQKERFAKGFLMPSQRFSKTVSGRKQDRSKTNHNFKGTNKTTEKNVGLSNHAGRESDQEQNPPTMKLQDILQMTQKERFEKGFLLPSERFNTTVNGQKQDSKKVNGDKGPKKLKENEVFLLNQPEPQRSNENNETFGEIMVNHRDRQNKQRKRMLDTEDICFSDKKKSKLESPKQTQICKQSESSNNHIPNNQCNEFIFAKPKVPVKKGNSIKNFVPEKLLAKSCVPHIEEEINFNFNENIKSKNAIENKRCEVVEDNMSQSDVLSNTDVSMRPSFIKRKLFTQKLDVAESKNTSSDGLGANSPQNIYGASMRERNKTRKLVTSSCLSREVPGEDNNVLDLIHKIVPPDQINNTNIANKTEPCNRTSKSVDNTEKWDVSTVIANCDNQDISDTYTDEEIFSVNHDKKSENPIKSVKISEKLPQCKILVEKLKTQTIIKAVKNSDNKKQPQNKLMDKGQKKINVTDWMKSFWDTDSDSDLQINVGHPWKTNMYQNQGSLLPKASVDVGDKQDKGIKVAPNSKGILSFRNFHKNTKLNDSLNSVMGQISSNKKDTEVNDRNIVEQGNNKVDQNSKQSNATSQTGRKKEIVKEHAPVNKNEVSRAKSKAKQCIDCNNTKKPKDTPRRANKSSKSPKHDNKSDNKNNNIIKDKSNHTKVPPKPTVKSKELKTTKPKQSQKDSKNKVSESGQKNKPLAKHNKTNINNSQKDPVRTQPKRKSKENSYIRSPKLKKSEQTSIKANQKKIPKNKPNTKSTNFVSNNTSINNTSIMTTRSRSKLSNHSIGCDYSSMNLTNISNRSLRFR